MNAIRYENLPVMTGEKVILRPITDEDTDLIVRWRNDPKVKQFFLFRETFTPELHRNWLRTKVYTGDVVQYIIIDRSDMKPLGSVYLRDVNRKDECAEYGIFIGDSSAAGKGIGTETANMFMDFAFNTLKLHRVFSKIIAGNEPSLGMCRKAGMVQEGYFKDMVKLDGEFKDIVFVARLAGEE